ncbi:hypothetical protein C8Q80DRAFT_26289 [Daedaleopsis nitida]|nr:hypothetical protein C8Q80DRAFT_26289 [Daedaleopsis nitida]
MKMTNYRAKLEEILENSSGATGAFSYIRTHSVSPNPGIDVDGFGALGLPLSAREAAALTNWSTKDEKERDQQGVVEISASKVHFDNPEWDTFIDRAGHDACNALGVPLEASQSHCELTKLLVRTSGTRLNVPAPAEANASTSANLLIILPSKFTGSTLCIAHDGRSETYEYSKDRPTSTIVLAWYARASATFAPVTDGHQLALLYTLVPASDSPMPVRLGSQAGVVARLRSLLAQWKEARQKGFPVPTQAIFGPPRRQVPAPRRRRRRRPRA